MAVIVDTPVFGPDALPNVVQGTNFGDTIILTDPLSPVSPAFETLDREVNAKGGRDQITTDGGDDKIDAGAGSDRVFSGSGDDYVYGGAGADILVGEEGDDWIYGQNGNDRIFGRSGQDYLFGQNGRDRIWGGADDDHAYGGRGNDIIWGEAGDDKLYGQAGDDQLYGGDGNDMLLGNNGEDSLYGGMGDDILTGQRHDDVLTGDDGADTFLFDSATALRNNWNDTITDFDPREGDVIKFDGFGGLNPANFADVLQLSGNLVVDTFNDTVTILGGGSILGITPFFGMNGSIEIQSEVNVTTATDVLNSATVVLV